MAKMAIHIEVQHFVYVKEPAVEKYAAFHKYAKPKTFMPTTSKKCQISKIWHKNMPVGNTEPNLLVFRVTFT